MPSTKCQKITVTVLNQTAKYLQQVGETSGISMGEIIDRLCLKISAREPAMAAELILEDFIIHIQELDNQQVMETIALVLASIRNILDSSASDNIQQCIADIHKLLEQ